MSEELNNFFARVSNDQALQEQLYLTKEIAEVAIIAKKLGFNVTAAQILRAQAGRVLMLSSEELEKVATGEKAKTGAQWGRGGKGYLENAGFWIYELIKWGYTDSAFEPQLEAFFSKVKKEAELQTELLFAKTCKNVAIMANNYGYEVSSSVVLRYLAIQILKLSDDKAEKVALGNN